VRVEVYAQVGLSNLYGVAQAIKPGAQRLLDTARAWSEVSALWHFKSAGRDRRRPGQRVLRFDPARGPGRAEGLAADAPGSKQLLTILTGR
jgi:hypothetical protein